MTKERDNCPRQSLSSYNYLNITIIIYNYLIETHTEILRYERTSMKELVIFNAILPIAPYYLIIKEPLVH